MNTRILIGLAVASCLAGCSQGTDEPSSTNPSRTAAEELNSMQSCNAQNQSCLNAAKTSADRSACGDQLKACLAPLLSDAGAPPVPPFDAGPLAPFDAPPFPKFDASFPPPPSFDASFPKFDASFPPPPSFDASFPKFDASFPPPPSFDGGWAFGGLDAAFPRFPMPVRSSCRTPVCRRSRSPTQERFREAHA